MSTTELAVRMADEWLETHRINETWRLINMIRDELVRNSRPDCTCHQKGERP